LFLAHPYYSVDGGYGNLPSTLIMLQVFDDWGNAICQNRNASFIWMKAVRLNEPRILRDPLEKERIERHAAGAGEIRENPIKGGAVFFAPIRRRPHPGQQQPCSTRLYFHNYRIQIGANFSRLDPAQGIVRTQFEDDQVGFFFGESPIHTGEAAGGGIARYSLVHDLHRSPVRPQTRLELGWKRRKARNPEPGGEAVAQDEDHSRAGSSSGFPQQRAQYHAQHRANCEGAESQESRMPLGPGSAELTFISHSPLPIPTRR
jgi:hypothetical protein